MIDRLKDYSVDEIRSIVTRTFNPQLFHKVEMVVVIDHNDNESYDKNSDCFIIKCKYNENYKNEYVGYDVITGFIKEHTDISIQFLKWESCLRMLKWRENEK